MNTILSVITSIFYHILYDAIFRNIRNVDIRTVDKRFREVLMLIWKEAEEIKGLIIS